MSVPSYLTTANSPSELAEDRKQYAKEAKLENNGFFPAIYLRDFETRYHVNSSYSTDRKLNLLQIAIQQTNDELLDKVCTWNKRGYYSLKDVPQQLIGNCGELVSVYRQAVYTKAMILISERYRATDTSRYGHQKADASKLEEVAEDYKDEYRQAIYTLIGRRGQSSFCELI